jgi:hypothetical protein
LFSNSVVFKGMKLGLAGCNKRSKCDIKYDTKTVSYLSHLSIIICHKVVMKASKTVLGNVLGKVR